MAPTSLICCKGLDGGGSKKHSAHVKFLITVATIIMPVVIICQDEEKDHLL
jgi:hypothetical protein